MEEKTPQRKALQRESKALMFQGAGERTARRARDEQNAQWNLGKPANPQGRRAHTAPAPPEQTSATADSRSGTDAPAGAASSTIDADSEWTTVERRSEMNPRTQKVRGWLQNAVPPAGVAESDLPPSACPFSSLSALLHSVHSVESDDDDDGPYGWSLQIERPLAYSPSGVVLARNLQWDAVIRRFVPWSRVVLRRFWESGYDRRDLLSMFVSIPPGLRELLKRTCAALEVLMAHRMTQLDTSSATPVDCAAAADPMTDAMDVDADAESGLQERSFACIRTSYDPDSQRMLNLYASRGIEHILGQHQEEVEARWANAENVQPLNQFEVLCMLIEQMFEPNADRVVYHRCTNLGRRVPKRQKVCEKEPANAWTRTGFLRHANRHEFDRWGRVTGVVNILSWASVEEFEQQRCCNPRSCRPLMHELGDSRHASELLACCETELVEFKLARMTATERGTQLLQKLHALVLGKMNPLIQAATVTLLKQSPMTAADMAKVSYLQGTLPTDFRSPASSCPLVDLLSENKTNVSTGSPASSSASTAASQRFCDSVDVTRDGSA